MAALSVAFVYLVARVLAAPARDRRGERDRDRPPLRGRHAHLGGLEPGIVGARAGAAWARGGSLGSPPRGDRIMGRHRSRGWGPGSCWRAGPRRRSSLPSSPSSPSASLGRRGLPSSGARGGRRRGGGAQPGDVRDARGRLHGAAPRPPRTPRRGPRVERLLPGGPSRGARQPEPRIFVYAPVLLFPVAGLVLWVSRRRGGFLACAAVLTAVGIGTVALFSVWWGGHSSVPGSSPTSSRRWFWASAGVAGGLAVVARARAPAGGLRRLRRGRGGRRLPLPLVAGGGLEHVAPGTSTTLTSGSGTGGTLSSSGSCRTGPPSRGSGRSPEPRQHPRPRSRRVAAVHPELRGRGAHLRRVLCRAPGAPARGRVRVAVAEVVGP